MRWRQAARDLEDPEIAAVTDADAEHLERAMPMRHNHGASSSSSSSSKRGRESARATPAAASENDDADASSSSSSPPITHRGGRHGLLPPPPWAVVVRDIERDRRRSNSGDAFAHQQSNHLSVPSTPASSSPCVDLGVENEEEADEEEEEEGAEAEDALESAKLLLAGGIAGAVSKTATAPLARLTILYQVQGMTAATATTATSGAAAAAAATSTSAAATATVSPIAGLPLRQALRAVVEREGVASLWRGNLVTVLHRLPYSAVNFWAYERLSEAWIAAEDRRSETTGDDGGESPTSTSALRPSSDTARRLACGGAAGMAACTLAYPLDLVRTRLAASSSPAFHSSGGGGGGLSAWSGGGGGGAGAKKHPPRLSVARTLADVVRADGPRGLYRGLGATLAQVGPSLALNYTAYGALRAKWMSGKQPGEPPTVRRTSSESFVFIVLLLRRLAKPAFLLNLFFFPQQNKKRN